MKLDTVSRSVAGSNSVPAPPLPGTAKASKSNATFAPPVPMRAAAQGQPVTSAEATQQAARQINEFLKSSAAGIEFAVDGQSDRVIVRVVDSATRQVIRQMPSEEALAISQSLDRMMGLLLKQRA